MKTKFSIEANDLLVALDVVSPAVHPNPVIPITDSVLLTNREISACNASLSIKYQLPPNVSEPFVAVINFAEIWAIANNSKGLIVNIEQTESEESRGTFKEKSYKIKVTCGDDVYDLNGQAAENFLNLQHQETTDELAVDSKLIGEMYRASNFVGAEDQVHGLSSLILLDSGKGMNIIGSDIRIIYAYETGIKNSFSKTIPVPFVKAISKTASGKILFSETTVAFESERLSVISLLLHSKAMDFYVLRPFEVVPNVKFKKNEMQAAISKISFLKGTVMELNFKKGEIVGSSFDGIYERSVKTSVDAEVSCEGEQFSLITNNLSQLLKVVEGNELGFHFTDSKTILILTNSDTRFWAATGAVVTPPSK